MTGRGSGRKGAGPRETGRGGSGRKEGARREPDRGGGREDSTVAFALERTRVGLLPIWAWGLVAGAMVWLLYLFTLAPSTAFWDASEYIATAHILGLPHPPGNPFFVMFGRVWDLALSWTSLSVAQRINLLSATASAGAAGFWFLSIVRIWAHFTEDRRQVVVAGLVAVLVGATAFTVWSQSNVNEKVYTVSLFFVAVVTYLAMLWEDVAGTRRGDRLVLLAVFLLGLGATNHQMSLLPVLALGVFVLVHRPRTFLRPVLLTSALVLGLVGYSVQVFFVPIRSAQEPLIDEADPECASVWHAALTPAELVPGLRSVVPDAVTCEPLRASMAREQYGKRSLLERQSPLPAQVAMYGQYFNWQWARSLPPRPRTAVTLLFVALGLLGLWRHWEGDRDSFVYFATLLVTVIPLLIFYLNFQYGYSLYPDVPVDRHEVRERDYFYIVSFNIWGLYAGLGIATLWQGLIGRLKGMGVGRSAETGATATSDRTAASGPTAGAGPAAGSVPGASGGLLQASPLLVLALLPLALNWQRADRRGDYSARDWAYNVLQSVEPYAVLFTNGDNDTFPLWYLQEVEGIRQDVTVIVHSYLGTSWYPKQLRDMTRPCPEGVDPAATPTVVVCQRPFRPEAAPSVYEETEIVPPSRPILTMSDEEIDRLPPVEFVDEALEVRFTDHITGRLPAGSYVTSGDLLVYLISRTSLGDRPVYFAATAPPVFGRWNLQPHLLRHGLAFKLIDRLLESTADTVRLGTDFSVQWLDLERNRELLWDVYQVDYLLDWPFWPEPSTRSSIPAQYYLAYFAQGDAQRLRDDPARAELNYRRANRFLDLMRIEERTDSP